jgi:hypothetical protein
MRKRGPERTRTTNTRQRLAIIQTFVGSAPKGKEKKLIQTAFTPNAANHLPILSCVAPSIICATNATQNNPAFFHGERNESKKNRYPQKENRRGEGGIQKERKVKTPKKEKKKSRNAIAMLGRAMDVS